MNIIETLEEFRELRCMDGVQVSDLELPNEKRLDDVISSLKEIPTLLAKHAEHGLLNWIDDKRQNQDPNEDIFKVISMVSGTL